MNCLSITDVHFANTEVKSAKSICKVDNVVPSLYYQLISSKHLEAQWSLLIIKKKVAMFPVNKTFMIRWAECILVADVYLLIKIRWCFLPSLILGRVFLALVLQRKSEQLGTVHIIKYIWYWIIKKNLTPYCIVLHIVLFKRMQCIKRRK